MKFSLDFLNFTFFYVILHTFSIELLSLALSKSLWTFLTFQAIESFSLENF